jgi:hypothetical protein
MAILTKGQLAQRVLKILGVNTRFSEADPQEVQDVLEYLEDWMLSNNGIGRRLGYIQNSGTPDPDESSGIPDWSVMGVTMSVAMMVAPYFGKQVPQEVAMSASAGMQTINSRTIEIKPVQYPNRMARGSGNRTTYGPKYYHPADRIETFNDFLADEGDDIITSE